MRDTMTIGTIGGLIGTLFMHITNYILQSFGMIKITTLQIAAALFMDWEQVNTTYGVIIGTINHFFIGAIAGVIIAIVLRYFGKDYYLLKGLGVLGVMYLAAMGFILPLNDIATQIRSDTGSLLGHIISYTISGIITTIIIYRYSEFKETVK